MEQSQKKERVKHICKKAWKWVLLITVILFWILLIYGIIYAFRWDGGELGNKSCNVSGIKVHGLISTYIPEHVDSDVNGTYIDVISSENIVQKLKEAEKDESTKAIIVDIDSPGGFPVAAEEIANEIKRTTKPIVTVIRGSGTSAAYWIASAGNVVFASKNSDVGGIGVTMSYTDKSKQNIENGITYNSLSVGAYKDMGDPDKPLTKAERKIIERDLKITLENFITTVAENRKLDIEKVRALADGSSFMGETALQNGFIDKIGGLFEAENYLKDKIQDEVNVCW